MILALPYPPVGVQGLVYPTSSSVFLSHHPCEKFPSCRAYRLPLGTPGFPCHSGWLYEGINRRLLTRFPHFIATFRGDNRIDAVIFHNFISI